MSAQANRGIVLMIMGGVLFFTCIYAFLRWEILAKIIAFITVFALTSVMIWVGWALFSLRIKKDAR